MLDISHELISGVLLKSNNDMLDTAISSLSYAKQYYKLRAKNSQVTL